MKRLIVTALVLLTAAAASRAAEPKTKDAKPVTVPFELLKTKHMTVMIKVNGKGPYRVIFDTGAPVTVLNTKIGKEAGLLKDAPKGFNLFATSGPLKVKELEVGDLKAEDTPAIVMDHPTLNLISEALGPIDGIVGFPFFARYRMTLDYKDKKMTFVLSGFDPPDVIQAMTADLMGLLGSSKAEPRVMAPAAQWGLVAAKEKDDKADGVVVKEAMPGGAAAAAGLKPGDRILTIDGRWTDTVADLYHVAAGIKAGMAVPVVIQRDKKEMTLRVKPLAGL